VLRRIQLFFKKTRADHKAFNRQRIIQDTASSCRTNPEEVTTSMTRGKKPEAAIAEAKGFAERMGYLTMDNRSDDLKFDFLIYKRESVRAVKVRQTRYHIDPNGYYDQQFPDEIQGLRSVPFPPFVLRELWLRTQHERGWRRLVIYDLSIGEIGWWGPDEYTNPHAR
jgi:hypothetical protein